jgi:hypothetical protein
VFFRYAPQMEVPVYEPNDDGLATILAREKAKRDRVMGRLYPDWRWKAIRACLRMARVKDL